MIYSSIPGHFFTCYLVFGPQVHPLPHEQVHHVVVPIRGGDVQTRAAFLVCDVHLRTPTFAVKLYGDATRKNKLSNLVQRMKTT